MESAPDEAEPISRPLRCWAADRNGITKRDGAAGTIPGIERSA